MIDLEIDLCPDEGCPPTVVYPHGPWSGDEMRIDALAVGGRAVYETRRSLDVEVSGPVEVVEDGDGFLDLFGVAPGTASLEVVDEGAQGSLRFPVREVDHVVIAPAIEAFAELDEQVPYTLLAGADMQLVVRLYADDGERVADEDLVATAGGEVLEPDLWDLFALPASDDDTTVEVVTGRRLRGRAAIPRADAIDDIALVSIQGPNEFGKHLYCFAGVADGAVVVGVTDWLYWQIDSIVPTDGTVAEGGCASIDVDRSTAVRVRSGELERTFDVDAPPLF